MRYQKSPQQMIGMALALLLLAGCAAPTATPAPSLTPEQVSTQPYWPTQGWRTSTPEEQGFDSAKLAEGLQALQETRHQHRQPADHPQRLCGAGRLLLPIRRFNSP